MSQQKPLTLDPSSIEQAISTTLSEMAEIYKSAPVPDIKCEKGKINSFSDGDEKDYQGLIITAEALECYFIPYFYVKGIREKFWKGELLDLKYISDAIKYIVEDSFDDPDNDGDLGLSGTPYINLKLVGDTEDSSNIDKNLDFLDSACFVLTALLDAKAINLERDYLIKENLIDSSTMEIIPNYLKERVDKRIYHAAKLIKECDLGSGKGWAYTNDRLEEKRVDQIYFTWDALESLDVVKNYLKSAPWIFPSEVIELWDLNNIEKKFADKRGYLSAAFLSQDNKSLNICNGQIEFTGEDRSWYYNIFVIIGMLITELDDPKSISKALKIFLDYIKEEKNYLIINKQNYFKFALDGSLFEKHLKDWQERAISALILKALILHKQKNKDAFNELIVQLGTNSEGLFTKYLKRLADERCTKVYTNVWDKQTSKYSIYYTERAIEALVKLYSVQYPDRVIPYYTKIETKSQIIGEKTSVSTSGLQITIDGEIIKESIIKEAQTSIENKIKELLSSEEITKLLLKNINKIAEDQFLENIQIQLGFLKNNILSDKPKPKYKDLTDTMEDVVRALVIKNFVDIIGKVLRNVNEEINLVEFKERFQNGLKYVANWETSSQGAIDFGKTFTQLEQKEIIQFIQTKVQSKKK